jgi:hypothetical protein
MPVTTRPPLPQFDFLVADLAMGSRHFLVAAIDRIEAQFSAFLVTHAIPTVTEELRRLSETARSELGAGPSRSKLSRPRCYAVREQADRIKAVQAVEATARDLCGHGRRPATAICRVGVCPNATVLDPPTGLNPDDACALRHLGAFSLGYGATGWLPRRSCERRPLQLDPVANVWVEVVGGDVTGAHASAART